MIPDDTKITAPPEELVKNISIHTHYLPLHWVGACHTWAVRNEVAELFPYKAKVI